MKEKTSKQANFTLRALLSGLTITLTMLFAACMSPIESGMDNLNNPNVAVIGVALNKTSTNLLEGGTERLYPTISPTNATNLDVRWKSNNTTIAQVSANGTVTALAAGTATITVTTVDGGKAATCSVTVSPTNNSNPPSPITSVSLNHASVNIQLGKTEKLTAAIMPANATNQNVTWSSSNTGVATVNNGVVTAVGGGSATITVSTQDGGKTATCAVTVALSAATFSSVTVSPSTISIGKGSTRQFSATVSGNNNPAQTVTWSVTGGGNGTSINTNGLLTVGSGETATSLTVKATSTVDTSKNGTATVTIKIQYTVTYNNNSGSGATPAAQTVNAGSSVTLASGSGLAMSGFAFGGWNTNSNGMGTNYNGGSSFTPTGNITLYAKWQETGSAQFNITFDNITDQNLILDTGITIYRTGGTSRSTTATINVTTPGDYSSIVWSINGVSGTGSSFTLNSTNPAYRYVGAHFLSLEVVRRVSGVRYNKTISFEVKE